MRTQRWRWYSNVEDVAVPALYKLRPLHWTIPLIFGGFRSSSEPTHMHASFKLTVQQGHWWEEKCCLSTTKISGCEQAS